MPLRNYLRNQNRRVDTLEKRARAVMADCERLRQDILISRLRLMALAEAYSAPVSVIGGWRQ